MRSVKQRGRANISGFFTSWLVICLFLSTLFPITAHGEVALPNSTQKFTGYQKNNGIANSPDGFFTLKASVGSIEADEFGAFISETSGNKITSYLEVNASGSLGSFTLDRATIGEFYSANDKVTNNHFTNVYVVGYSGVDEVAKTTPYDSPDQGVNYEANYGIDYSPFIGKKINRFRVYYTAEQGTKQTAFNLVDFTISDASLDPPPPAPATTPSVTVQIGSVSGVPGRTVTVPVSLAQATAGVGSYGMKIKFDETALEVVSASDPADDPGFYYNANNSQGSLMTAWVDFTGGDSLKKAGDTLFTIEFKIKEDATLGDKALTVIDQSDPMQFSFADENADEMGKTLIPGKVTVQEAVDAATPTITSQPLDQTSKQGDASPGLTVGATVSDGGTLSYQWYSNTTNSTVGSTLIIGATNATYAAPTTTVGTTYYYVVVTNTNAQATGNQAVSATSNIAAVTVASAAVPVTGVTLDQPTLSLTAGGSAATLTATVAPANATNKSVTWSSSDTDVATVVNGVVTPVGQGTATITVTTQDGGFTATSTVTVASAAVPVTGVTLDQPTLSLTAGGSAATLTATVTPANATNKSVTWSSSDTDVATVVNGVVTPVGQGTATITVTTQDGGFTATSTVTVASAAVPVTGVTLDQPTLSLTAGGSTATLTATVTPANATNKSVTWSSSDSNVATVANGVVTPVGQGTATITVTTQDGGFTAASTVTVASAAVPVTGVTLDQPTLSLTAGGSAATLTATVTPANATNKRVTWSSSDTDVATVVNGVVTPVGQGTATITVTTQDGGFTAASTVTVASASPTLSVPDAPTNVRAIAGNGEATISFTAPARDGGSPITSYTVTSSPDGISVTRSSSPITITGLTNGTAYTFTVIATNSVGDSASSSQSNGVTPTAPPQVIEVTAIDNPAPVTGIPHGTAKTVKALGLPKKVSITLSDGSKTQTEVDWDIDNADYDPTKAEAQSFTVHGALVRLPQGVNNPGNLRASIRLSVNAAEPGTKNIVAISNPSAITDLPNGTPKSADALDLPKTVEVTLSDGSTMDVRVEWDVEGSSYDPADKEAQSFVIIGVLLLPDGITNTDGKTAKIRVSVKADNGEKTADIVEVIDPEDITGLPNGTPKTASALGLPEKVRVVLDDESTLLVRVKWDVDDADYDPDDSKRQKFIVTGSLTKLPDGMTNSHDKTAKVSVTVNKARKENNDEDNNTGGSKQSGSGHTDTSGDSQNDSTRKVIVEAGSDSSLRETVEISRRSDGKGNKVDEVILDASKTKDILKKARANGKDIVRIIIDDLPKDPADKVEVSIRKKALDLMKEQGVTLEIKTGYAAVTIDKDMLASLPADDLYFEIVPIKQQEEAAVVSQRVLQSEEVQQAANGQAVQVVGQPMKIEANYSSIPTSVFLPLKESSLPNDPNELQAFLASLSVYVEHTDGEKELLKGQIQYDEAGKPIGITIAINKFSMFSILSMKGTSTADPNRLLTRAEVAVELSKLLKAKDEATMSSAFSDVQSTHWATAAIQKVSSAGLMTGDGRGQFHPDAHVTRAEVATIIAKWKQISIRSNAAPTFSDTRGHWAANIIEAVKEQGILKGYGDGSFHPNQGITGVEMSIIIQRLTGREK